MLKDKITKIKTLLKRCEKPFSLCELEVNLDNVSHKRCVREFNEAVSQLFSETFKPCEELEMMMEIGLSKYIFVANRKKLSFNTDSIKYLFFLTNRERYLSIKSFINNEIKSIIDLFAERGISV